MIETCPDCGRKKACNALDLLSGYYPKWYAVRDAEAANDCCGWIRFDQLPVGPFKVWGHENRTLWKSSDGIVCNEDCQMIATSFRADTPCKTVESCSEDQQ